MRIITKPTVTLVSRPAYTPHPVYELPYHAIEGEQIIAMAGKVCYDSYGVDGNAVDRHATSLVDSGHHSVLEHVHVGVFIEGVSRGCSHEIVRHRMFNYSQRSTRYTAEGDAAIVLDPFYADLKARGFEACSEVEKTLLESFLNQCFRAIEAYTAQVSLLEVLAPDGLAGRNLRKWCRGKARQLLPHAIETRMVMTGNLRAWRHFLVMRSSRHAEAEIRRLAEQVYNVVTPIAPNAFADLNATDVGGYREWTAA
ncbi:FAD-dependent thymidylate synthase [soil metagenome]